MKVYDTMKEKVNELRDKKKTHLPLINHHRIENNLNQLHEFFNRFRNDNDHFHNLNNTLGVETQLLSINLMEDRLKSVNDFISHLHHYLGNKASLALYDSSTTLKYKSTPPATTTEGFDSSQSKLYERKSKLMSLYSQLFNEKDLKHKLKRALSTKSSDFLHLRATGSTSAYSPKLPLSHPKPKTSSKIKDGYFASPSVNDHIQKNSLQEIKNELNKQLNEIKDKKKRLLKANSYVSCDFENERRIYLTLFRLLNDDKFGKVRNAKYS